MSTRTETFRVTSRIGFIALLCCYAALCSWGEVRTVGPQGAHLRAAPSDKAFVATSLPPGASVMVSSDSRGEWVSVVAPPGASVWIYGDLVRDDAVIAPRMLVRAGPGIDYEGVGELKKGDRVRSRKREGDWLQIEPPPGTLFWLKQGDLASVAAVARPPEATPRMDAQSSPAPDAPLGPGVVPPPQRREEPLPPQPHAVLPPQESIRPTPGNPVEPPSRRHPPRPPIRRAHVPTESERTEPRRSAVDAVGPIEADRAVAIPQGASRGRNVVLIGRIKRAPFFPRERYSNFRLVRRNEKGQTVTVCYLLGPDDRVESLVGHEVKVSGIEYVVPDERYPALSLQDIELAP